MILTLFVSIVGFLSIKAISVYSVYNENYKDTVYIEISQPKNQKKQFNKYELLGKPSGIIQSGHINNGKRFIIVRRFDNSELERIEVGLYDYKVMEIGDTIIGKANEVAKQEKSI